MIGVVVVFCEIPGSGADRRDREFSPGRCLQHPAWHQRSPEDTRKNLRLADDIWLRLYVRCWYGCISEPSSCQNYTVADSCEWSHSTPISTHYRARFTLNLSRTSFRIHSVPSTIHVHGYTVKILKWMDNLSLYICIALFAAHALSRFHQQPSHRRHI